MNDGVLMGLDVGGGGGRCLLLDLGTGETTVATRPWRFESVPGGGGMAFDLDLPAIWSGLASCAREALERSATPPERVRGVAATSLRLGTVVLDEKGEALLAVPNRDARAAGEGIRLAIERGEALHRTTGRWPNPIFALPRLQWLAAQRPEHFARAHTLLSISDWLTWRLCGERTSEASQAGETLLFDLTARDWAWDWIDRFELPRRLFPEISESGAQAGTLSVDAASDLGLTAGVAVAIGGGDTQCGLLGAGAVEPGEIVALAGTTAPVQLVVDEPCIDPEARLWSGHHLIRDRWILESNAGPMGEALSWIAGVLYPEAPLPEARLLAEADLAAPGASGQLSTLGAEVMNGRELSMPVGDITLCHLTSVGDARVAQRDFARAIAEGMACALRANLEQVSRVATIEPTVLRLAGGLSRSPAFARILAGVADLPVSVSATAEASALGAALCAGVACGAFPSLRDAAKQHVELRGPVRPDPAAAEVYREVYTAWTELREKRSDADRLATGRATGFALRSAARPALPESGQPRPRILVCADFDRGALDMLSELGDVEYASYRDKMRLLKEDSLVEALQGYDVFVTEIDLVDAASLPKLPELRVVAACRGDAVNVDVAACSAHGIPVLHTPGRNADAVADLTIAFLLMLARKLPGASAFLREPGGKAGDLARMGQAFVRFQGRELWNRTVGLVGLGAVGRGVAERLRGFGARVLVADPYIGAEPAARLDAELVPLEDLLRRSDFVSLHAAVTDETRGLLGTRELASMKPGAALVNTARAALIDEAALLSALESGVLAGAALDTFSVEPPGSDHPLLALDEVIATPHVGGNTVDVAAHQGRIVVEELARLVAGERPDRVLNAEVLDGFSWAERRAPTAEELATLGSGDGPAVTDLAKGK